MMAPVLIGMNIYLSQGAATIGAILDVRLLHSRHLNWPQLDVDIELESLDNLENYPLVYK